MPTRFRAVSRKVQKYHNINVVYTKEAETADQYIEKVAIRIGRRYRTTVATSDGVIQLIIRSQGCILWSARDFREEIERVRQADLRGERENIPAVRRITSSCTPGGFWSVGGETGCCLGHEKLWWEKFFCACAVALRHSQASRKRTFLLHTAFFRKVSSNFPQQKRDLHWSSQFSAADIFSF